MKVNHSFDSLQTITKRMGDILGMGAVKKPPQRRERVATYPNQFSSFAVDAKRVRNGQILESTPPSLNMLKRFVEAASRKCISYRGLISSHLQSDEIDLCSDQELKAALAIQRMLSLVNATITEIKAIELNQISHNKA